MDQKILREYLLSLGFRTDSPSATKFRFTVRDVSANIRALGVATAGAVAGTAAMVHQFAKGMEAMYYKSRLAQSAVGNLRALEYGGKQIGLTAETVTGAVTALARTLRANPGYQALLEQLGVKVQGRDMSHVMRDMVAQLRKMPGYVGQQFAGMFGMDPDTFLLMSEGLEKYDAAVAERLRMDKEAGLNADEAAKASVRYANAVDRLTARIMVLKDTMAVGLVEPFEKFVGFLDESMQKLDRLLRSPGRLLNGPEMQDLRNDWKALGQLLSGDFKGAWATLEAAKDKKGPVVLSKRTQDWVNSQKYGATPAPGAQTSAGTGGASSSASQLFAGLEARHGLPRGLLDRMWAKESGRGTNMYGPPTKTGERALGHFQFMAAARKDYGVKDPFNLEQSAEGAARFMSAMGKKYGGDWEKALAAYNWGPGNVDKFGIARAPAETRDYMGMARGLQINAPTTIIVQGAGDPAAVARAVVAEQNANLARNLGSTVQ